MNCMLRALLLFLLPITLCSQNFEEVDQKVLRYPDFTSIKDLGIRIQNDFSEDTARVRAAFVWLTHAIRYEQIGEEEELRTQRISYSSETEKQDAIEDLVWIKINKAFELRKGVCIDFSLMLHALIQEFGLSSKIITGVGKTEVKRIDRTPKYRNHSWNAVKLQGVWKLMDATWAAGYVDTQSNLFVRKFDDHYFFTEPADFIRHHLPANEAWQLLEEPMEASTFFEAPVYLPEFCGKGITLAPQTSGILTLSKDSENYIAFETLPREHLMHYSINGSKEVKRLGLRKNENNTYTTRIRLRKRFNRQYDYVTVFMNEEPILNFKIEEEIR